MNRDEKGDALGLIAQAKECLSSTPTEETADESGPISERVEAVRVGLFDSIAMVDVAGRAISPDRDWCLRHTLEVIGRQIDAACTALELIAGDAGEVAHG